MAPSAGQTGCADDVPAAELLEDRVAWPGHCPGGEGCVPCGKAGCDNVETLFPPVAGPHPARQLEDPAAHAAARHLHGCGVAPILDEAVAIHKRVLKGRVWVALHMHAGDGNVHTNIPVNSDDYEMLQTAHEAVAASWCWPQPGRRDLGRARHRHHQAGVLTDAELRLCRLQAQGGPGRPLQQGQVATKSGELPALAGQAPEAKTLQTLRHACRFDQRLHAQLWADGARVAHHAAKATLAPLPIR